LLADGRPPDALRPYLGSALAARGTAFRKTVKDGSEDARPVCPGEAIRRMVCKALLATEILNLKEHRSRHQLAVGHRASVKAMPQLARQWLAEFSKVVDWVVVCNDESTAHNVVDRRVRPHAWHLTMVGVHISDGPHHKRVLLGSQLEQRVGWSPGLPSYRSVPGGGPKDLARVPRGSRPPSGLCNHFASPSPADFVGHGAFVCRRLSDSGPLG
jgi:hypothetical protein